jgi:ferredoxin-type protein NapH
MKRGWCGHLCPVGAFYSLVGKFSLVRLSASKREACNNCLDCFAVCPEQHVIRLPLKGAAKGVGPMVTSSDCSNCGRCIDVCAKDVFTFGTRFASNDSTMPGTDCKLPN